MFEITQVGVGGNAYLNAGNCSYCILFIEDLLDVSATATATTAAAAAAAAAASRVLLFNDALASTSSSSSTYQVVSDLFLTCIHACIVGKVLGGAEEE